MNTLKKYILKGILFVLVFGSLSHMVYEWFGKLRFLGYFFPINESIWEHMKLCFFPTLLYSFSINEKWKAQYPCITSALLAGILLGTFSIPVMFYTYSGILGYHSTFIDISIFVVSVLLTFAAAYKLTLSCKLMPYQPLLKLLVFIMGICFIVFTYYPPGIGIFIPPV